AVSAGVPGAAIKRQQMTIASCKAELPIECDDFLGAGFDVDEYDSPLFADNFVICHALSVRDPLLQRNTMRVFRVNIIGQDGLTARRAVDNTDLADVSGRVRRSEEENLPAIRALRVQQIIRVHRVPRRNFRYAPNLYSCSPASNRFVGFRSPSSAPRRQTASPGKRG